VSGWSLLTSAGSIKSHFLYAEDDFAPLEHIYPFLIFPLSAEYAEVVNEQ